MKHRILIALLFAASAAPAATKVALVADPQLTGPAKHGLSVLQEALRAQNIEIAAQPADAAYILLLGTPGGNGEAARLAQDWHALPPESPESLTIQSGAIHGKPVLLLCGSDSRGLMYAALDTAARIATGTPLTAIPNTREKPFVEQRGVSMYTMQRAYFESRLYDAHYWEHYFNMLAAARINNFVVIFGYENGGFMAPLYPYFFNVDQYPGVEFVGLTPAQQTRNRDAFNALIRMAHDRGISVTAGIWDHIYRGGVQGGGIPGASENAGKRVPGLVWGVTADNLSGYTKAALNRFLEVFPDIDAIQFRMHDESGLKPSEMQSFWHDVFVSIKQTHPKLRIDLRAKGLPDAVINDATGMGLNAQISTKYWMEQMGLPFHPTHINTQNQKDRRHGYADLLHYPQTYRVHWQLWNGGTARVLLWADPEYVRRFAESVRLYDGNSFEVNEMLATKMLGEPHDEPPLDILQPAARYYTYEFERYWNFYQVWGRVSYNPQIAPALWESEYARRFGAEAGLHVMKAVQQASQVLPRIVAASYLYSNFPTTRGWAEMNRQGSLLQYANEDGSDIAQFMNVRDEAKSIVAGTDTAMRRPEETSRWFAKTSDGILAELAAAGKPTNREFESTATDLKILAGLARYHSLRLLAGVSYNLYKQTGDLAAFDDAIKDERSAIEAWKTMADAASGVYSDNLAFGAHAVGFSRNWKEEYGILNRDFEKLLAERQSAVAKTDHHYKPKDLANVQPPVVTILPAKGNQILVKVADPASVKSLRLRYRHVTQYEDYETADMALDPKTGTATASIPTAFITPKWDLMYYIEAIAKDGSGRIYPDLEKETPYVITTVRP
jgi:hypothetical protein